MEPVQEHRIGLLEAESRGPDAAVAVPMEAGAAQNETSASTTPAATPVIESSQGENASLSAANGDNDDTLRDREHTTLPALTPGLLRLMAFGGGASVANMYYCQPLLEQMQGAFRVTDTAGQQHSRP